MNYRSFFILLLVLEAHSMFNVTIKCQPCTTASCYIGQNCFKITDGQGYSNEVCGPCRYKRDYQIEVGKCLYDMYGRSCSTGICYY